jgi:mono/diheme cytochrome c family protein
MGNGMEGGTMGRLWKWALTSQASGCKVTNDETKVQMNFSTMGAARVLATAAFGIMHAAFAADVIKGADLYKQHCTGCHGSDGRPKMPSAPDFSRATALLKPDTSLLSSVRMGLGAMPAYQGQLRDREILDIVAHMRTFR